MKEVQSGLHLAWSLPFVHSLVHKIAKGSVGRAVKEARYERSAMWVAFWLGPFLLYIV